MAYLLSSCISLQGYYTRKCEIVNGRLLTREQAEPQAEGADDQDQQIVAQVEEALAQELEIDV